MIKFLPLAVAVIILTTLISFRGQIKTEFKRWQLSGSGVLDELNSKAYLDRVLAGNGQFDPTASSAVWDNKEVVIPGDLENVLAEIHEQAILGENTGNKWIEVDLSKQHVYAHEGDKVVMDFPASTGLPWLPTVTGEFHIWAKVRAQRMTGGSVANGTFYDLPNVPFVQFFYNGYSFHGTYWHHDFGYPRSHGCVNLSIPDAEKLYYWTDPTLAPDEYARYIIKSEDSTRVVVHGVTPTDLGYH